MGHKSGECSVLGTGSKNSASGLLGEKEEPLLLSPLNCWNHIQSYTAFYKTEHHSFREWTRKWHHTKSSVSHSASPGKPAYLLQVMLCPPFISIILSRISRTFPCKITKSRIHHFIPVLRELTSILSLNKIAYKVKIANGLKETL